MANKPRPTMTRADRAKQFAPFSALKGLPEELQRKEKIVLPRRLPSPDMAEQLDRMLKTLQPGHMAEVVYYREGEYLKMTGMTARVDRDRRLLQLVEEVISFDDLFELRIL